MRFGRNGNGHDDVVGCIGSVRREHDTGGHLEGVAQLSARSLAPRLCAHVDALSPDGGDGKCPS